MPDIKIKPTMDKPKVLEKNHVPKDAGSLLKQRYEEQRKQREPEQTGGVRYATERTEGAAKHGSVIAGMAHTVPSSSSKGAEGREQSRWVSHLYLNWKKLFTLFCTLPKQHRNHHWTTVYRPRGERDTPPKKK